MIGEIYKEMSFLCVMKEVQLLHQKQKLYFTVWELLKQGKNPATISKELNITKQKISYYTTRLKELGVIEKVGYGTWKVKTSTKEHLEHALDIKNKKIRGHAFIWTVKLPNIHQ